MLRSNPMLKNSELIVETNKSQRTITRTLSSLKEKGLISRVGANRNGYWQVK